MHLLQRYSLIDNHFQLVKLDILKLSNLDTLFAQLDIIKNEYNEKIELKDIPFDDEKTWNLICDCDTMGIFQMESEIGKGIIKQIQPRNIEELSAVNAFVRPGTSGLEEYCIAKKDNSKIPKFHPKLDKILAPTYGGIVYQEQIMSLISEMMNISFGKADIYRRALEKPNKKGNVELVEDFIKNGVKKAVENGITKEAAEKIQKLIVDNAGYLFNKSHSITYSVISYWTAYIKANYPLVFYISLLNNEPTSKLQDIIQEAKLHNVKILPPDISKSKFQTIIEDKDNNIIRIGLCTVKGIGEKAVQELEPNQPYYNFNDYFSRSGKGSGKAVVEAGIKIGAFESIPLIVSKDSITDELREKLRIEKYDDDNVSVFMSIGEQLIWYNNYIECKAKKSTPNFAIPIDMIKGKYLVDDGIVIENDNTLIIPETFLENFELKEEDVLEYKTRKKPKGKFKDKKQIALSVEERAFRKSINDLLSYKENKIEQYLSNMEDFELSFIEHPLERASKIIPLLNDVHEDAKLRTAGIIVDIIPKTTKNGKQYYHIMLQTPREKQKLTVWNNIYLKQKDLLVKNRIVKVFGKKSFGGITVEYFEDAKSNY